MNLPELAQQFKDLKAKVENFFSKSANAEQAEAFKAELDGVNSKLEGAKQLETDLEASRKTVVALEAENKELKTAAQTHKAELEAKEKDVETRAAAKAATIAASQGIKPVPVKAADPLTGNSANSVDELSKRFESETDAKKKWELFQQLKKARGL